VNFGEADSRIVFEVFVSWKQIETIYNFFGRKRDELAIE
jgi:hypothetical protein